MGRSEVAEQVRRLGAMERDTHESARGDRRIGELATLIEKLAHDLEHERGEIRSVMDLSARTEATGSKVEEIALVVERLAREMRQGGERIDMSVKSIQEDVNRRLVECQRLCDVRLDTATRTAEQLRVTEGAQRNELWREIRDLRGQFSDFRIRCGSSVANASGSGGTPRLGSRPTGSHTDAGQQYS